MIGQAWGPMWWTTDGAGIASPPVTEASAMGLPPFGRGVAVLASAIAGAQLRAYRHRTDLGIDVRIDPAPKIVSDPVLLVAPWNWRWAMVEDLVLYGNHFAILGEPDSTGWPTSMTPVDATTVELGKTDGGDLVWRIGGQLFGWGAVWHVAAGNRSGRILGRGALAQYRDSLSGALATERSARNYFTAGGLPSAVMKASDPNMSQARADGLKQRYRETVGRGSREPLVIPGDIEFTPVVSDAEKQQLVEARKLDAHMAALMLGVPVHKLGLAGPSMTYQNVQDAELAFIQEAADRWAQPIESAATKWLLPHGQVARFDWSGRMRTDPKTRAETYKAEIDAGLLTVNEARARLDRPPLEELDAVPAGDPSVTTDQIPPGEVAA